MAVDTRSEATTSGPRRSRLRALRLLVRHPWLLTAAASAVLLALPPTGGDLAAQEFYAWLFRAHPTAVWNDYWYGGHLLGGYSLLYPPLAGLLGARLVGALAAVAAATAANTLFTEAAAGLGKGPRRAAQLASAWFAVGVLQPFVVGQMPFIAGLAFGLGALVAARRERPWWAAVAALAASLSSPLVGAFLLMVALAWTVDAGLRRTAPLTAAVVGLVMAAGFGGGGWFPFPRSSLLSVLIFCVLGLALVRRGFRSFRLALVLYGGAALVICTFHNPVGGNVARLGALVGGPVAAAVLGARNQWRALAVLAVPLAAWQLWPLGTAVDRSIGDPSSRPAYYAGLAGFLRTQDPGAGRVEVPSLRQHWEAYYIPRVFPIARGWERQLDLRDNEVLYRPDLTPEALHDWLVANGVGLVALPDAPLDYWSRREGQLVAAGQPWLTPVWSDAHWRVWRVADSTGLAGNGARLTRLDVDSFAVSVDQLGASVVRIHWNPFWEVSAGLACLRKSPDGWTTVVAAGPGSIEVRAEWTISAAVRQPDRVGCD
ncbi:MAG: hypothetical protein ACJ71T_14880 [Actinomycetales bacterium]